MLCGLSLPTVVMARLVAVIALDFAAGLDLLVRTLAVPLRFASAGRGGADLTVDGGIEAHPGHGDMPEAFETATPCRKNRILRCILCDVNIARSDWRRAPNKRMTLYVPDMDATSPARRWLRAHLPSYDHSMINVALSLCLRQNRCSNQVGDATSPSGRLLASAAERITASQQSAALVKARHCDGSRCAFCATAQRSFRDNVPAVRVPAADASSSVVDMTLRRAKWKRGHKRDANAAAATAAAEAVPQLTSTHIIHHQRATHLSGLRAAEGSAAFADVDVAAPSHSVIRRDTTRAKIGV